MKKNEPKNTFSNLPREKRQRIVAAAVREFAGHGFQKASINAMVKELNIAKGSLYQYFQNKEALFLYVFDCFTELVKQRVRAEMEAVAGGGFFARVETVLWAGIRFIGQYPDYFRLYLLVLFEANVPRRQELLAKVRLFSADYFGPLCIEAQGYGEIRSDAAPQLVVFLLDALLDRFLQGYARPYLDGGLGLAQKCEEELQNDINKVIEVLKNGLTPQG